MSDLSALTPKSLGVSGVTARTAEIQRAEDPDAYQIWIFEAATASRTVDKITGDIAPTGLVAGMRRNVQVRDDFRKRIRLSGSRLGEELARHRGVVHRYLRKKGPEIKERAVVSS